MQSITSPISCCRVLLLGLALGIPFDVGSTLCCTCGEWSNAKSVRDAALAYSEGPNASKIIFAGSVEKQSLVDGTLPATAHTNASEQYRQVFVRVLRVYRGEIPAMVTVVTGQGDNDCGFDFDTGAEYLVYAEPIDVDKLFTTICMGTSLLLQAGPALRVLRGEEPAADDLLDAQHYYDKFAPVWTASVCGHVTKTDGTPLGKAWMDMTPVRTEPFLPTLASDSNLAKPDGSFCIRYVRPGKYLLTAERLDFKDYLRWAGYYPGVAKQREAVTIDLRPGENLSDVQFRVGSARVHTLLFRIVAEDGSTLPLRRLGVAIDAADPDALAYHLAQSRNVNGVFPAGYVPPGYYVVQTYVRPEAKSGTIPRELARWRMAKRELYLATDAEIVLKLTRAN